MSGISFNISGNGVNKTVTTGADGTVDVQIMPGVYTVTEQSIDRYETQSVYRVTIVSGHTATVTFNKYAERTFGVPREISVSLLFVETRLGTFLGQENILKVGR